MDGNIDTDGMNEWMRWNECMDKWMMNGWME
jgi:hypothetical protein